MFAFVGETLRRLRKERAKTLAEIGAEARLGRGQLSRIENSRQEATLSTLGKILNSQGVSRREFFRRYDLVEAEALARDNSPAAPLETLVEGGSAPVAQGAIEIGDVVVHFRVVSKSAPAAPAAPPEPPPVPIPVTVTVPVTGKPGGGRGSRKKNA
jgi:transcriptional regulator with XRE-family HTH domain